MDWSTIQNAIQTWFADGTGLTVVWFNQPRPRMEKPMGLLQILTMSQFGNDMVGFNEVAGGTDGVDYAPTVRGQRSITVNCQVYSRDQSANLQALYYLERARARAAIPNAHEALRAAGVALWTMSDVKILDVAFDKRMESRASFDVTFGIAENIEFAEEADNNSWIEHVEISADYSPGDDLDFEDEIFGYPI